MNNHNNNKPFPGIATRGIKQNVEKQNKGKTLKALKQENKRTSGTFEKQETWMDR